MPSAKRKRRNPKDINAGLVIPSTNISTAFELKSDIHNTVTPIFKQELNKSKDINNLRKILFKSKKKSSQEKASLKDFLSTF